MLRILQLDALRLVMPQEPAYREVKAGDEVWYENPEWPGLLFDQKVINNGMGWLQREVHRPVILSLLSREDLLEMGVQVETLDGGTGNNGPPTIRFLSDSIDGIRRSFEDARNEGPVVFLFHSIAIDNIRYVADLHANRTIPWSNVREIVNDPDHLGFNLGCRSACLPGTIAGMQPDVFARDLESILAAYFGVRTALDFLLAHTDKGRLTVQFSGEPQNGFVEVKFDGEGHDQFDRDVSGAVVKVQFQAAIPCAIDPGDPNCLPPEPPDIGNSSSGDSAPHFRATLEQAILPGALCVPTSDGLLDTQVVPPLTLPDRRAEYRQRTAECLEDACLWVVLESMKIGVAIGRLERLPTTTAISSRCASEAQQRASIIWFCLQQESSARMISMLSGVLSPTEARVFAQCETLIDVAHELLDSVSPDIRGEETGPSFQTILMIMAMVLFFWVAAKVIGEKDGILQSIAGLLVLPVFIIIGCFLLVLVTTIAGG